MRFANPWCLLLILPALIAGYLAWRGGVGRRATLTYPGAGELPAASWAAAAAFRMLPPLTTALVLILVSIALARPQKITREVSGEAEGIDILLSLDTSLSMRAIDFKPLDRMAAAKDGARNFITGRVSDRIGIVVFGGDPLLTCPLTLDYDALLGFLDGISAGMTNSQGTAIGDGIAASVNHLKDSTAKSRVIILLTDGSNNTGLIDPITAAKTAAAFGIKIYTIGTGKRGDAMVPVDGTFGKRLIRIPDQLDEDTLIKVAYQTEGKYFRATSLKELGEVYKEIDRLEKTEYERPETVTFTDLYAMWLIPAALLLAFELAATRTLLLKVP